jgi:RHS repeat-associated protein
MTQSGSGVSTSTYAYDDQDNRVKLKENNTTSIFPNALYNVVLGTTTATTTKHIFASNLLVATIENVGTTTTSTTTPVVTTRYVMDDNLGGSSIVTNASGTVVETLDYYPYGGQRVDKKVGSYVGEKNKYAGTQYDSVANLNYMQARYQDSAGGQFLSEDPVFLGNPKQQAVNPQSVNTPPATGNGLRNATQSRGTSMSGWSDAWLRDPQGHNSYSYGRNNPIKYVDAQGQWYKEFLTGQQSLPSFKGEVDGAAYQLGEGSTSCLSP